MSENVISIVTNVILITLLIADILMVRKMEKQMLAAAAEREASMASYIAELQALRVELEDPHTDSIRQRMKDLTGAP